MRVLWPSMTVRAGWALLVVLLSVTAACTRAPVSERPEPAGGADVAMFSESEAYERFMGRWSRLLGPPFL